MESKVLKDIRMTADCNGIKFVFVHGFPFTIEGYADEVGWEVLYKNGDKVWIGVDFTTVSEVAYTLCGCVSDQIDDLVGQEWSSDVLNDELDAMFTYLERSIVRMVVKSIVTEYMNGGRRGEILTLDEELRLLQSKT